MGSEQCALTRGAGKGALGWESGGASTVVRVALLGGVVQQLSVSLPGGSALICAEVGVVNGPVTEYAVIAESV